MFLTKLLVEASPVAGQWVLLADLIWQRYVDGKIERYVVPKDFVTDLASVPSLARGILQQNGRSRRAAVLHDFLYKTQPVTRAAADKLFLIALTAEGVITVGRWIYYLGVRAGGFMPWNVHRKRKEKGT